MSEQAAALFSTVSALAATLDLVREMLRRYEDTISEMKPSCVIQAVDWQRKNNWPVNEEQVKRVQSHRLYVGDYCELAPKVLRTFTSRACAHLHKQALAKLQREKADLSASGCRAPLSSQEEKRYSGGSEPPRAPGPPLGPWEAPFKYDDNQASTSYFLAYTWSQLLQSPYAPVRIAKAEVPRPGAGSADAEQSGGADPADNV